MDAERIDKLGQVIFERLVLGETQDALRAELRRKLEDASVEAILQKAIADIATLRDRGAYAAVARRIRKRRLFGTDRVWRNFGMLLLVGGGLLLVVALLAGSPGLALGPLLGGFLILVFVEPRMRAKEAAAEAAVDSLFEQRAAT